MEPPKQDWKLQASCSQNRRKVIEFGWDNMETFTKEYPFGMKEFRTMGTA